MQRFVVLVGPAGSGKSTLARFLAGFIESRGGSALLVNLDPAVESLPYDPHVDVRAYVRLEDFTREGLGPNGALVAAVGSLVNFISDIRRSIDEYNADIVIVDTPGQLEVFAYRVSGSAVLHMLAGEDPAMTLFLMDAPFFEDPLSIVSALTLASSVFVRLRLPQLNLATKADLLAEEVLEEIIPRLGEEGFLEGLVYRFSDAAGVDAVTRDLAVKLAEAVTASGFLGEVLPVSVHDDESIARVYARILQFFTGGHEFGEGVEEGEDKRLRI